MAKDRESDLQEAMAILEQLDPAAADRLVEILVNNADETFYRIRGCGDE